MTPQKPLRADGPVKQNVELDPRRVTASGRPAAEGSRPPSTRGDFHRPRRLSSSALGRRAASGGRWLNTGRMSSGHRHGGQSKRVGSGVGRSEAFSGSSPRRMPRRIAVAVGAPVRLVAPRTGPVVARWVGAGLGRPRSNPLDSTHQGPFICSLLRFVGPRRFIESNWVDPSFSAPGVLLVLPPLPRFGGEGWGEGVWVLDRLPLRL